MLPALLAISSWAAAPAIAQTTVAQATAASREEQRQQQVRQVRPENYDVARFPVSEANVSHWRNILWTTAIVEPQADYVAEAIAHIVSLTGQPGLSNGQRQTVDMAMQIGTQLYFSNPSQYAAVGQQFLQTAERSPNPEWVAMALSALVKTGMPPEQRQQISDRIRQRFANWQENVYLYSTLREIAELDRPSVMPPLQDLLEWTIAPGQLQMYVLCRSNRGVLCQTVLKDGNGEFVRQGGQLWSVPLLLRSLHELSWNFTRGQTPQGIYRIEGTRPADPATFRAYGAFSLVKLFLPYEAGVQEFLPGQPGWTGGVAAYQSLLPPSWRNYAPVQQSYWAGRAGRSLFRIHGSGEDPGFFTNNSRYPTAGEWNPTIGCLSALERYDAAGRLQQADMPTILNTLSTLSGERLQGYLVVVDVPGDANTPVQLNEIEAALAGRSQMASGQPGR
ncbi:hypothetical protein IQ268_10155 [Oculatella sp. LEGE 06141]|nr:hypothetical protein [Oculatella sp. LEGE 06141]